MNKETRRLKVLHYGERISGFTMLGLKDWAREAAKLPKTESGQLAIGWLQRKGIH